MKIKTCILMNNDFINDTKPLRIGKVLLRPRKLTEASKKTAAGSHGAGHRRYERPHEDERLDDDDDDTVPDKLQLYNKYTIIVNYT